MKVREPIVSVVIPTHNRLVCLRDALSALAAQHYPHHQVEVIVVADGCTDGTEDALQPGDFPWELRIVSQPAGGAAAARNQGARVARGELLLFIDDDVIASPELVGAHAGLHATRPGCIGVGPYRLEATQDRGLFVESLRVFWDRTFAAMADPAHRSTYKDVLSGNLSIPASLFAEIGGFNPAFPGCGYEDYELGIRLLHAGIRVVYLPEAAARHLETTDIRRAFQRFRREGSASVVLAELHPSVLDTTGLVHSAQLSRWLAFGWTRGAERLMWLAEHLLGVAEALRLERPWSLVYARLQSYWFWRGVRDEVGDRAGWRMRQARLAAGHRAEQFTARPKSGA